ncbi:TrbM/KikA/MpfK family conjugal transfer protein [Kingella kingae]
MACEANVCLSSGDLPGECRPWFERYFCIKHKRLLRTMLGKAQFF